MRISDWSSDVCSSDLVCRVLRVDRSVLRFAISRARMEPSLRLDIIRLATQYGRYGYRRIHALLQREGWQINQDRKSVVKGKRVPVSGTLSGSRFININTNVSILLDDNKIVSNT